jgi:hypothetical protein
MKLWKILKGGNFNTEIIDLGSLKMNIKLGLQCICLPKVSPPQFPSMFFFPYDIFPILLFPACSQFSSSWMFSLNFMFKIFF